MLENFKTLYIIGNGFDLHHGIKSSYSDFYDFAEERLGEYFCEFFKCHFKVDVNPWHYFENALGTFDSQAFYQYHDFTDITSESFRVSDAYGLEDAISMEGENMVKAVKKCLNDWIESIDISFVTMKFSFDSDAFFISFNYTSTLQKVYSIDDHNIFHIHGKAEDMDDLIFGHGDTRDVEKEEIDIDCGSNRTIFSDSISASSYPFFAFQKPVSDVIVNNNEIFTSFKHVEKIVVIGHSLNKIDIPYFQEIAKQTTNCDWIVYCFNEADRNRCKNTLSQCGVL